MKSKEQLLSMVNQAIISNGTTCNQWFIRYSGHVNVIGIDYYDCGWDMAVKENYDPNRCTINLDSEDSIQEGYWFIKNRLSK